tara:strand:- start:492 stop:755 length:264 start_codon:yes stop_codon:yes gene_type:complete
MRLFYFSLVFFFSACLGESSSVLPSYTGAINEVVIVMDDPIWNGASGDSLRMSLSKEVPGISWSEPLFDLIQVNSEVLVEFLKRTVI